MSDTATTPRISMTDIGSAVGKLQALAASLPEGQRDAIEALMRAARVAETNPPQYNPFLPGVHTDPHPHYRRLLDENPVHYSEAVSAWVITRYAHVVAAFRDPRLSSRGNYEALLEKVPAEERDSVRTVSRFVTATLSQTDPPEHTRLRRLMTRALGPVVITRLRPLIQEEIDALLDGAVVRGTFDLVGEFAYPLPLGIGAAMLALPEGDRHAVLGWTLDVMLTFSEGFSGTDAMRRGERAILALTRYFGGLIAQRRAAPGDDVISAMLAEEGATDDEVTDLCVQLLMGIQETIRHTITVGMLALLQHPAALAALRADPSLIPAAVEEMIRYDVISPMIQRTATEELSIGEQTIRAGDQVILLLAAANRDPERFACPHGLNVERRPNPHVAFGSGIHTCPGAALGRASAVAAVTTLLARLPDLRLDGPPVWREEGNVRGLAALPLAFTPSRVPVHAGGA